MATLEKPKKNKTKRTLTKKSEVNTNTEESTEIEAASLINKEKPTSAAISGEIAKSSKPTIDNINELVESTSANRNDIVAKECFIASLGEENISLYRDKKTNIEDETKITTPKEEIEQNNDDNVSSAPSAPPCTDSVQPSGDVNIANLVHYPQIERFQYEEAANVVTYSPSKAGRIKFRLSASTIQPLTQEQLKQYYQCADLAVVQQFEMEFLMNSLLETYNGEPLYEALKEYYHMQSKLIMNLHDVKKFRKEADAAQEHIWVEVPITQTFTDKCGDNIEVKESVTYKIIQVDGKSLQVASSALTVLFDIISNTYISNFITTKIIKIRINENLTGFVDNFIPSKTETITCDSCSYSLVNTNLTRTYILIVLGSD